MNSMPKPAPTPAASAIVDRSTCRLVAPSIPPISPTATIAITIPIAATMLGRSPSETPTATGSAAATTPVTGATTVMLPRDRAAYSPSTAALPETPATKPQPMAAFVGPPSASNGIVVTNTTNIVTSLNQVIAIGAARRLVRPPT